MTLLIAILIFLLLSAFFSGAEIAFISANKLSVEVEKDKGTRRGRILARFYENPKNFLSAMLVGNNIALVVFTTLAAQLLKPFLAPLFGEDVAFLLVSTLLVTVIVLLFGEFLPKVTFRLFANEMMHVLAYPLAFFQWLLAIPTWVMTKASNFILKYVLRTSADSTNDAITMLDLQDFVEGSISPETEDIETDIFKNALHLKELRLDDCMVPRTEISSIDISDPLDDVTTIFEETRHSRIIVTKGDVDNIIGYVHHQQLLKNPSSIKEAMIDIDIVPETMSTKDLMLKFVNTGTNIACVVDEFGGTAGIITLEDILEEIFGEIEDEHEAEEYIEEQISENRYRFSGRLEISYLNEKYPDLKFPDGDYNTLSGYIVMTSGDIPDEGEELQMGRHIFRFESVTEKKIEIVLVDVIEQG